MRELKDLVRPSVWKMKPYSSARDEFKGTASVYIDANENPYNQPYNRYPDPMQWVLKDRIAAIKEVDRTAIFLGNGSDEPIDLLIRAFCTPGVDNILSIDPSYGMYQVAADTNDIEMRRIRLNDNFSLNPEALLQEADRQTKIVFLCSPNNPSGNNLARESIYTVLNRFEGLVVVDEAYIDFSSERSFTHELKRFPNLVVLQTLSKAWGAAAIRLGMAFAAPDIIAVLSKVKYPYNINQLTQEYALEVLSREETVKEQRLEILRQRTKVERTLLEMPFVKKVYPSDANFILVCVEDANKTYDYLVGQGVIVRNRTNQTMCEGCLRITIGTPEENTILLNALKSMPL